MILFQCENYIDIENLMVETVYFELFVAKGIISSLLTVCNGDLKKKKTSDFDLFDGEN